MSQYVTVQRPKDIQRPVQTCPRETTWAELRCQMTGMRRMHAKCGLCGLWMTPSPCRHVTMSQRMSVHVFNLVLGDVFQQTTFHRNQQKQKNNHLSLKIFFVEM